MRQMVQGAPVWATRTCAWSGYSRHFIWAPNGATICSVVPPSGVSTPGNSETPWMRRICLGSCSIAELVASVVLTYRVQRKWFRLFVLSTTFQILTYCQILASSKLLRVNVTEYRAQCDIAPGFALWPVYGVCDKNRDFNLASVHEDGGRYEVYIPHEMTIRSRTDSRCFGALP